MDTLDKYLFKPSKKLLKTKSLVEEKFMRSVIPQARSASSGTDKYGFENIVGVGISEKMTNNGFTGIVGVTVYVAAKASRRQVAKEALIPDKVNGITTDVVATGEFQAFPHKGRYRSAPGGVSLGHFQVTAGTLGCMVRKGNDFYILSNNHVLANVNNAAVGDPIVQPGTFDGGQVPADVVANLSEFIPIQFNDQVNTVDAAIAKVVEGQVTTLSKCFGNFSPQVAVSHLFQVVKKCGRTTQLTRGIITDVNATVRVGYGTAGPALFQDQIVITGIPGFAFSQPGDSGSLILSQFGNNPVGLLFAGSSTYTLANKIQNVMSALGVSVVA